MTGISAIARSTVAPDASVRRRRVPDVTKARRRCARVSRALRELREPQDAAERSTRERSASRCDIDGELCSSSRGRRRVPPQLRSRRDRHDLTHAARSRLPHEKATIAARCVDGDCESFELSEFRCDRAKVLARL